MPTSFNLSHSLSVLSRALSVPPLTRILLLFLLALSALNAYLRYRTLEQYRREQPWGHRLRDYLSNPLSNPALSQPALVLTTLARPWTLLTSVLIENTVVNMVISGSMLWLGGRYLERAWGSKELAWFMSVVAVAANLTILPLYTAAYDLWPRPYYTADRNDVVRGPDQIAIQGFLPLSAAFLVAFKQLVPEHTVSLLGGAVRIRIKHFPAILLLVITLTSPITHTALLQAWLGFLSGWIYLRFYRVVEIDSTTTGGQATTMRGDRSDTFAFVAFFPEIMRPFINPWCDLIYAVLVRVRLLSTPTDEEVGAGNRSAAARGEQGLPGGGNGRSGGRRADAERRRALALQALELRLNAAAATERTSGPAAPAVRGSAVAGDGLDLEAGVAAADDGVAADAAEIEPVKETLA